MKFIPKRIPASIARLGTLTDLERLPDISLETPLLMLYTKRGSVPHITKDTLQKITTEQELLTVSLPTTIGMTKPVKLFNSFSDFIGLKEYPILLTIQDPAVKTAPGCNEKDTVAVWTKRGKQLVNADQFMDIIETFKPDLYVALCDGNTNIDSTSKRIVKSLERSRFMLDRCLARHFESKVLQNKGILAAVEGGYDTQARSWSIKNLEGKNVAGYVIDGLHNNGPDVENILFQQIEEVMKHTISLLPEDKIRVSIGGWHPLVVMHLVELGIDIFESSYPYFVTEQSCALTFLCDDSTNNDPAVMSMADSRHTEAFIPICESCECLTCRNHTRAYLHHLHNVNELLSPVLLMIHNTHHYLLFFKEIRNSLRNGTFGTLKSKITKRFGMPRIDVTNHVMK